MDKKRILVVDDEQDICDILTYNLTAAGYDAQAATTAEEAYNRCQPTADGGYDLLLLDVMMPGMSGFELAQRLRDNEPTATLPVIFLTAKDTEDDMLHGFRLGADDYIKKPFSVREVMARINAVLSRSSDHGPSATGGRIGHEGLEVDLDGKTVSVDGRPTPLTRTEFRLLTLLLGHADIVFSRQQLIDSVWPKDVVVTGRAVDVNIARLRKKLGHYGQHIVARQGFGYLYSIKNGEREE